MIPTDAERLAILTALIGSIGWLFTKGIPSLVTYQRVRGRDQMLRVQRLERENGRLKRALLVLTSAIELGVSVDKLTPYVRSARKLIEGEADDLVEQSASTAVSVVRE